MTTLLRLANLIDRLNKALGWIAAWLTLVMALIGAFNALARYVGRHLGIELSSNGYIELQWYLFGVIFLLGAAETLRAGEHVRVDVLYNRLNPRQQQSLDLVGMLLLVVPLCGFGLWVSLPSVANSWAIWEISPDPGGLPRYPIKTLVPVAFATLGLQGLAEACKSGAALVGNAPTTASATHKGNPHG